MSLSVTAARAPRRPIERPGFWRGMARMAAIVATTFAALFGALWYSSLSSCATTVCRLDVPVTAVPQVTKPPAASSHPPKRVLPRSAQP